QADANSFLRFCAKFQDRKKDDNTYEETTWTIKFNLNDLKINGSYKLRPALASAQVSNLQVSRQVDPNNFSRFCSKFQERFAKGDNIDPFHFKPLIRKYLDEGITVFLDIPLEVLGRRIADVGTTSFPLLHHESGDAYLKVGFFNRRLPIDSGYTHKVLKRAGTDQGGTLRYQKRKAMVVVAAL
ncbi:hypothetical protein Tco_1241597, partial [Tanacetum coccineum]